MEEEILNDNELLKQFIKHNHEKYLKRDLYIGFVNFPEVPGVAKDTLLYKDCYKPFEARFTRLSFGENNEFQVDGIVTDRCELKRYSAFGGHEYIDEAKLMRFAAVKLAEKHDLMIFEPICCWPHVRIIVSKPDEAHLRCFVEEQKKLLTLQ